MHLIVVVRFLQRLQTLNQKYFNYVTQFKFIFPSLFNLNVCNADFLIDRLPGPIVTRWILRNTITPVQQVAPNAQETKKIFELNQEKQTEMLQGCSF